MSNAHKLLDQVRAAARLRHLGLRTEQSDCEGWAGTDLLRGYYFRETRFLSDLRLKVQGMAPEEPIDQVGATPPEHGSR